MNEIWQLAELFEKLAGKKKQVGTIYLIHFEKPIGNLANPRAQASHYVGWSANLSERLGKHSIGQGSSIMRWLYMNNIGWEVARTWFGTRDDERAFKRQANSKRYCPICSPDSKYSVEPFTTEPVKDLIL